MLPATQFPKFHGLTDLDTDWRMASNPLPRNQQKNRFAESEDIFGRVAAKNRVHTYLPCE